VTPSIRGDFGELVTETEAIEVASSLPRPDRSWRYTDRESHEHYWQDGYPTLTRVVDETYWCADCGDEHTESHLECPLCGEHIEPGTVGPSTFREFMPGRTSYWLNGEPITPERAREILGST
jgi:hypothetical protein